MRWCLVLGALLAGGCSEAFNRTTSWLEEVKLADGSTVWLERSITRGPDAFFRPGRGGAVRSTLAAQLRNIGTIEFVWNRHEIPVSFDVAAGVPWVVLPIGGLDSCEKYGNPAESVAAFSWHAGKWSWQPFEKAPPGLRQNLLRSTPFGAQRVVKWVAVRRYDPGHGVALTRGFIPRHVRWEHACHRINPPPDPRYQASIKEYLERPRIALEARVVEVVEDPLELSLEQHRATMGFGDQEGIIGCKGKVDRRESIFSTQRQEGGGTRGTLTAYRVVLPAKEGASRSSIFLPARVSGQSIRIARVACSDSLIYVLVREADDVVSVLAYDLDGRWRQAWRVRMAGFGTPGHGRGTVFGFRDHGDRFTLDIGEYRYNNGAQPIATLGKRFLIEAAKQ